MPNNRRGNSSFLCKLQFAWEARRPIRYEPWCMTNILRINYCMVATGNHIDSDPLRGAPPSTGTAVQIVVIGFSKQSHDMRLKKHRRAGACSRRAVKSCEFTLVRRNRWCLLPAGASPRPTLYTMLIKSDNHNSNLYIWNFILYFILLKWYNSSNCFPWEGSLCES